ncbi:response regulator transcription factor [Jeotgalibaca caeni]|uniref:response regulator transcription factor n=1 Tax=Jeotgalibaca caeni TaxID=3028623 RepID=UPI00237D759A|nr:response regulator transcription factor [Jeotgalibaca caeni]MDE1548436.1 response regulator transcription factor [Jeotgalibaca caeni]
MIKVALIDDEQLIREGMKIILESQPELTVVASGSNGKEAFDICAQQDVDIVLMDIRMPESDGIEGTRLIKEKFPEVKILILTTFKDHEYIHTALQFGASGYLLKDSTPEAIYNGIKTVLSGNTVFHADVSSSLMEQDRKVDTRQLEVQYDLTEKEMKIIQLVAQGLSNKEISQTLFLSEGTIKNNMSMILNKLELRDRTQLAIFAYKNHLMKD